MALVFPSDQWIRALSHQLNHSKDYEQSATDWEGDFVFVVEPDANYQDTAFLFLGLYHGKSPDAARMAAKDERETEFAISAPFGTWCQVIQGKLDPIQGMMMGKLKLTVNLRKILRYPRAAQEIISCCALVPTQWG